MSFRNSKRRISATLLLDGSSKVQTNRKPTVPSLEPLEGMVICPIDLNMLDDPRLLPCGHAFCCDCLTTYMGQLQSSHDGQKEQGVGTGSTFACPICRMACPLPESKSAKSLPKAFNHIVILEFLRKNQLSAFQVPTPATDANGTKSRKSSIQVSSQMLNYLVSDISARERDGRIGPTDRAVILDEVTALLERLNAQDKTNGSSNAKNLGNPPNNKRKQSVCSTSSTSSPTGSLRQVDRFNAFASKARNSKHAPKLIEIQPDTPSYTTYRDAEGVRLTMKDNAAYGVLNKGKDCCIMRLDELHQPVDMRLVPLSKPNEILRQTVTTDEQGTKLVMWFQLLDPDISILSAPERKPDTPKGSFVEFSGPVRLEGGGTFKINYLRFFRDCIYLTGTVTRDRTQSTSAYPDVAELDQLELNEYGLVVCCATPSIDMWLRKEGATPRDNNPFSVQSISCAFWRDSIGSQRPDQPIIFGLDIDHSTGEVYVAQPANAMISRLHSNDMSHVTGTWYLNEPQLSPHFVCYAEANKQIWATCPREERIAILDLETDGFHHFNPISSFGINPSHIIYTSNERIILLDQSQSRMYWITKIHQTICVQCLDLQFKSRLRRRFLVIQPMDDALVRMLLKSPKDRVGGILCAHDYGCSIVSPIRNSGRPRLCIVNCYSLCGH